MSSVQSLLDSVSAITEKYNLLYERTGEKFNIFKILNVDEKEVRVCRLLCELLSPKGSHCQGTLYLELFVRDVLNKHLTNLLPECEFEAATTVDREFCTKNNRRVDLVIQTYKPSRRFIPIEVKITAKDLPMQCEDYFEEAMSWSDDRNNVVLFYLTPSGEEPEPGSRGRLKAEDIICISFKDDILPWLKDCLQQSATIRIAPIREVIQQFIAAIKGFTNQLEDDIKMETIESILGSPQTLRSAVMLRNSVDDAIDKVWQDFLEKVRSRVKAEEEYFTPESRGGSLAYAYKGSTLSDKSIEVQLGTTEKDGTYVQYYCDGKEGLYDFHEAVSKKRNSPDAREFADEYFYWESCHLPGQKSPNLGQKSPKFVDPNDALYALADEKEMEAFVNVCVEKIEAFIHL